jgi:hypothetical protein
MAATLKHRTQRALALYRFMDVTHPLYEAWLDYQHAKAHALPCHVEKARLKAELRLETQLSNELEKVA